MRLHLRPLGVSQYESFHPKLESRSSHDGNLEASVRSAGATPMPHCGWTSLQAGLNGAAGRSWRYGDCGGHRRAGIGGAPPSGMRREGGRMPAATESCRRSCSATTSRSSSRCSFVAATREGAKAAGAPARGTAAVEHRGLDAFGAIMSCRSRRAAGALARNARRRG
jgi:hypothetical protein